MVEVDVMIEGVSEYTRVIAALLNETRPQVPVDADAAWEELMRSDPNLRIVCRIPMPPPMQALHIERWALLEERLSSEARDGSTAAIDVRIMTVSLCMERWIISRIPRRESPRGTCIIGVGAAWNALVIEERAGS